MSRTYRIGTFVGQFLLYFLFVIICPWCPPNRCEELVIESPRVLCHFRGGRDSSDFRMTNLPVLAFPLRSGDTQVDATPLLFRRSVRIPELTFQFALDSAKQHESGECSFSETTCVAPRRLVPAPFIKTAIAKLIDCGIPESPTEVIRHSNSITTRDTFAFTFNWLAQSDPSTEMLVLTHLFRIG